MCAARRVNMRERPINVKKPMAIVKGDTDEVVSAEEQALQEKAAQARKEKEEQTRLAAAAAAAAAEAAGFTVAKASIPTPGIKELSHNPFGLDPFNMPPNYIKLVVSTGAGIVTPYDHYDLMNDDLEWLTAFNAENGLQVTEDQMESLLDLFEKEAFRVTVDVNCEQAFPLKVAATLVSQKMGLKAEKNKVVEEIYRYWIKKRCQYNKALMRQFQLPPEPTDPSPHVAFRPRNIGRRISSRNPRKNDPLSLEKLKMLKRDFVKVQEIYAHMRQRERCKMDSVLLSSEMFDVQFAESPFYKKYAEFMPPPAGTAAPVVPVHLLDPTAVTITGNYTLEQKIGLLLRSPLPRALPEEEKELEEQKKSKALKARFKIAPPRIPNFKTMAGTDAFATPARERNRPPLRDRQRRPVVPRPRHPFSPMLSDEESTDESDPEFYEELQSVLRGDHPRKTMQARPEQMYPSDLAADERSSVFGLFSGFLGRGGRYYIDRMMYPPAPPPSLSPPPSQQQQQQQQQQLSVSLMPFGWSNAQSASGDGASDGASSLLITSIPLLEDPPVKAPPSALATHSSSTAQLPASSAAAAAAGWSTTTPAAGANQNTSSTAPMEI